MKDKIIEEMAKDLKEEKLYALINKTSYMRSAENLYDLGYRKIPQNAVVLTEERNKIICDRFEQLERVQVELQELNAKYYNEAKDLRRELKRVRKETAEKLAERVKMAFYYEFDELIPSIMADKIDEICKELTGVRNGDN